MVIFGDFTSKHLFRLHQLVEPVQVLFRVASISKDGLLLLDKAARLYRRHSFILVMRRSYMYKEGISDLINKTRRLKNVYLGVIEDEQDHRDIQRRRNELFSRLTKEAT